MTVWIVMWDNDIQDICSSKENAISAAKNFLAAELEDKHINTDELLTSTLVSGHKYTITIYEQETDLWA